MRNIIRRVKENCKNIGMKTQVSAYVLVVAFLPFILIILYLWQYCSSVFSDTILKSSLESYKTKVKQVENYSENFLELYDKVLWDPALLSCIKNDKNPSLTSYWLNRMMEKYMAGFHSDLVGVYILTKDKKEYLFNYWPDEYHISIRGEARKKYGEIRRIAENAYEGSGIYTEVCTYQGIDCTAVSRLIGDGGTEKYGNMVFLFKNETLKEMIQQISEENLPWGFCMEAGSNVLCMSGNYQHLSEGSRMEESVIDRVGWKFTCVVNAAQMSQDAFGKFGLVLIFTIAAYILVLIFISKVVNRQLHILHTLQKEMERVSREGTYQVIETPRERDVTSLFNGYNLMVSKISSQERIIRQQNEKNIESVNKQKIAELKAMELEINPHYLYNTLNTISGTAIEHQDYQVSRMLKAFSSSLVYILRNRYHTVPLHEEIRWLKDYLILQKERFQGIFDYEIDVDPALENAGIYKLLIQPFVENAILHGFSKKEEGGLLTILFNGIGDGIEILILDNGKGIPEQELCEIQKVLENPMEDRDAGLGILNSCRRMQGYYGKSYSISIESRIGEGTTVRIWLPVIRKDEGHESHNR